MSHRVLLGTKKGAIKQGSVCGFNAEQHRKVLKKFSCLGKSECWRIARNSRNFLLKLLILWSSKELHINPQNLTTSDSIHWVVFRQGPKLEWLDGAAPLFSTWWAELSLWYHLALCVSVKENFIFIAGVWSGTLPSKLSIHWIICSQQCRWDYFFLPHTKKNCEFYLQIWFVETKYIVNLIRQMIKIKQHCSNADSQWMFYCNLYLLHS